MTRSVRYTFNVERRRPWWVVMAVGDSGDAYPVCRFFRQITALRVQTALLTWYLNGEDLGKKP